MPTNIPNGNKIDINSKNSIVERTTCKDFYWPKINTPTSTLHKWSDHYTNFHSAKNNVWLRIFKFAFKIVRDNNWLCNIKVKESKACDYCGKTDDIAHFFKNYPHINEF